MTVKRRAVENVVAWYSQVQQQALSPSQTARCRVAIAAPLLG
jgi:hypothetical protein